MFRLQEFESQQALFDYVQQDGYGWDEDKPGLCYAFTWQQDDAKKKYEMEVFFGSSYD